MDIHGDSKPPISLRARISTLAQALSRGSNRSVTIRCRTGSRHGYVLLLSVLLLSISSRPAIPATAGLDASSLCLEGSGNFGLDITVCSSAIRTHEENTITLGALYLARGRAYRLRGECQLAIDDFTHAEEVMPFSAAAAARRGVAHRCLGQYSEAHNDLSRALDLNPYFPAAWRDRGITHFFNGETAEALKDLKRSLEIDAYDAEAHTFIALCHFLQGEFERASEYFDRGYSLGHAWQYLPLWQLLTRQQHGLLSETFRERISKRIQDRHWPAPLYARFLDVETSSSIVRTERSNSIKIHSSRRIIEGDFYEALYELMYGNQADSGYAKLLKLSEIQLNPPSAELAIARLLIKNEQSTIPDSSEVSQ